MTRGTAASTCARPVRSSPESTTTPNPGDDGYGGLAAIAASGDLVRAEARLGELLAERSGELSLRVANLAIEIKLRLEKFAEALGYLGTVAPYQPDDRAHLKNTALALIRLDRHDAAVEPLLRLVALFPDDHESHYLLSFILPNSIRITDVKAAQEHARRAVELMPDNAAYHAAYGRILLHSSRAAEAEDALRRALAIDPENAAAWNHLGDVVLELDRVDEAIAAYERALAIVPTMVEARRQLQMLRRIERHASRERLARFPRAIDDFADSGRIIERFVLTDVRDPPALIAPESRVFTLGSCFAANIANALRSYGVAAQNVLYPDEINSTYANRYLLEWLNGRDDAEHRAYGAAFGDAFRAEQADQLRRSDVVIVSLGVAPCFFERDTGAFALTFGQNFNIAIKNHRYTFRTTTVAENVENLRATIDLLRAFNPAVAIFLTVSPVPLKATFERGSAIVADCVSKSTLRVAAEEIVRLQLPDLFYWPSFEIVRWAGGYTGDAFGRDDGSPFHVTNALVERIMYAFVQTFGTHELASRAAAVRSEREGAPT